jgi:hypothetical protein
MVLQKTLFCSLVIGLVSLVGALLASPVQAQSLFNATGNIEWHAANREPLRFEVKGAVGYYVKASSAEAISSTQSAKQIARAELRITKNEKDEPAATFTVRGSLPFYVGLD